MSRLVTAIAGAVALRVLLAVFGLSQMNGLSEGLFWIGAVLVVDSIWNWNR